MYSTEGIVIKEKNVGEADRFFTIFTKDFGKIRVLGKGVRKIKAKLRAGLQLFHHIHLEFIQGRYFYTATEAINIDTFQNLKKNPEKLEVSFYIVNLLDRLVTEERDERIWFLILKILKKIEKLEFSGPKLKLLARYFEWNLLAILGYRPELYNCIACQTKLKEGKLYFSPKEGGILCQACKNKDKEAKMINVNTLKLLRLILGRKKEILEKLRIGEELAELKRISKSYLEHILEEKIDVI